MRRIFLIFQKNKKYFSIYKHSEWIILFLQKMRTINTWKDVVSVLISCVISDSNEGIFIKFDIWTLYYIAWDNERSSVLVQYNSCLIWILNWILQFFRN